MGIRIFASTLYGEEEKYKLHIKPSVVDKQNTGKKEELAKTPEELLIKQQIEQFKEQNSPKNKRISEIYGKFRAGKELSQEELKYLAENSPELYKEVIKIMQERKAMEREMELAKTKQEVTSIRTNHAMCVKKTMGTGNQAESQAETTMARVNQLNDAYVKYTATLEYKEKEDERSQALERKEKLQELEELLEETMEETLECAEDQSSEEFMEQTIDSFGNQPAKQSDGLLTNSSSENLVESDESSKSVSDTRKTSEEIKENIKTEEEKETETNTRHKKKVRKIAVEDGAVFEWMKYNQVEIYPNTYGYERNTGNAGTGISGIDLFL